MPFEQVVKQFREQFDEERLDIDWEDESVQVLSQEEIESPSEGSEGGIETKQREGEDGDHNEYVSWEDWNKTDQERFELTGWDTYSPPNQGPQTNTGDEKHPDVPEFKVQPVYSEAYYQDDLTVSLDRVAKTNPKTGGARDYWNGHFREFRNSAVPDLVKNILLDDTHPQRVAVIALSKEKRSTLSSEYQSVGIEVDEIGAEIEGSSILGMKNAFTVGEGAYDLVVAGGQKSEIDKFKSALQKSKQESIVSSEVGELLGLPDCCLHVGMEQTERGDEDRIYEAACRTDSAESRETNGTVNVSNPYPLLNVQWRFIGLQFLPYVPCSFDCEHSIRVGYRNYKVLHETGHGAVADAILSWLDLNSVWNGYSGLAHVKNTYWIGNYTTDDYWGEKVVIWNGDYVSSPNSDNKYDTQSLEGIDANIAVPGGPDV